MISMLVTLALGWIVVGLILWVMMKFPDVPPIARTILIVVAVICTVFYLANEFGLTGRIHDIPVPRVG